MRALLRRRDAKSAGRDIGGQDGRVEAPGRGATRPDGRAEAPGRTTAPGAACALLTCPGCGAQLETLTLRCPRCRTAIPLGCSGNCRACGK